MVSTLLPFALLALAFSSWHAVAGYREGPLQGISTALGFIQRDPNFTIDPDNLNGIVKDLTDVFSRYPNGVATEEESALLYLMNKRKDTEGETMFKPRMAQVMHLMLDGFNNKDNDQKVETMYQLYLFTLHTPRDAAHSSTNLLWEENEDKLRELVVDKLNYAAMSEILREMKVKTVNS
ncbi:hypothetical protein PCANC_02826 [Puccinia coronata f. sp. avenae]|uniref:Uncharacterized protein n=1 Tax=Puccinia coronata f. sp. avenae TaxID=200324 RepID=A0A2N5W457_9BASI|nr:hypothetical protein PCANC_02826 [Puccinia coronata f. sp. avenae]